tara:strand:+ start:2361 stop:2564 length:204 start_codon:yes stop_codon:yes gene_type:complete
MTINAEINRFLIPVKLTMDLYQLQELAKFLSSESVQTVFENNVTLKILSEDLTKESDRVTRVVENVS